MTSRLRHVGRRLILATVGLVSLSVMVFALFDLTPGRALDELSLETPLSPAAIHARQQAAGPAWTSRYGTWARRAIGGDFGESVVYGRPVMTLVGERLGYTLGLALPGLAVAWLVALPAGLWSAARSGGIVDRSALAVSSLVMAVPDVVLAFLLMWATVRAGLWEPGALLAVQAPSSGLPWLAASTWRALAPALMLVILTSVPALFRHVRITALSVLAQPSIGHARARGVSARRVLGLHVTRAALPGLLMLLSSSLSLAVGGALVAEVVFSWPGVGALLYRATLARDEPLVAGIVMVSAMCLVLINVCGEVAADSADPRVTRG